MTTHLAIDCMGGDHGLATTVTAALAFLQRVGDARLLLVGDSTAIKARLDRVLPQTMERIEVVHASEVVAMDDPVEVALRKKKDSSMRLAIGLIKDGRADACVSAGNTGALMAISRYLLKTMEGIDRPAIAMGLPNQRGGVTTMLDLGANVDCQPDHLLQFAVMGSALAAAGYGRDTPSVGLLNIGEEVIKGNDTVKQAGELLRASRLNFLGNVEGDDIFKGTADVVVCDGFVGNVLLKTSEGMAQMLGGFIKEEFTRNPLTWAAFLVALPVLNRFRKRVDHRRYNGAALLGLRGLVLKSHGSADALAFEWALQHAYEAARNDVLSRIGAAMQSIAAQRPLQAHRIATPEQLPE
jgi:glycerol-3-phosphate acyltransferase PlsX